MSDAEAPLVRPVDDEYALWDGAYVLGSLSCADRREFEAHLSTCVSCRLAVGELCGLPGLLRLLSLDDMWVLDEAPARGAQDVASIDPHDSMTRWRRRVGGIDVRGCCRGWWLRQRWWFW